MPRYFFHVIDGQFLVDTEGTECTDMAEVRSQAIQAAGQMLSDKGELLVNGQEWQMHVTDETRKTVFKLRFSAEELEPYFDPLK
jgi:hypothetical protein